jgi:predicted cupin superfamily sugar epimerase
MLPVDLIEHPEGGRFREVFRSANTVITATGSPRSALTHIYFSDTVLVGCSVAPGFEFSDFTLIDPHSQEAKRLLSAAPEMARYTVP